VVKITGILLLPLLPHHKEDGCDDYDCGNGSYGQQYPFTSCHRPAAAVLVKKVIA